MLGDLGQAFETIPRMVQFYQLPYVMSLVTKAKEAGDDSAEVATWTLTVSTFLAFLCILLY